jgi:hypothetical protein
MTFQGLSISVECVFSQRYINCWLLTLILYDLIPISALLTEGAI